MLEWRYYSNTQLPDDPLIITRQCIILAIAGLLNGDVNELELGNVSANAVGAIAADAKMVVIATPRRLTFFKIFSFHFESDVGGNRECATREKSRP